MRVPTVLVGHIIDLDEANAALNQAPGHEALSSVALCLRLAVLQTVATSQLHGLALHATHLKRRGLHAIRQFVAGDACIEFGQPLTRLAVHQVQIADQIQGHALASGKGGRRREIHHRSSLVPQSCRLKRRWQETVRIIGRSTERPDIKKNHVTGQILVHRPKTVGRPGTEAGLSRADVTGVQLIARRSVIVGIRLHGVDETKIVHMFGHFRKKPAHPGPGLAVLLPLIGACQKFVLRAEENVGEFCRLQTFADGPGKRLPPEFLQQWLVIKGIHMRRAAHVEEKNDRLRPGREMRGAGGEGVQRINLRNSSGMGGLRFPADQRFQGEGTETGTQFADKAPPRERLPGMRRWSSHYHIGLIMVNLLLKMASAPG